MVQYARLHLHSFERFGNRSMTLGGIPETMFKSYILPY